VPGQRWTFCNLSIVGQVFHVAPSCAECAAVILQNEQWIAQLEVKDEADHDVDG
jgi:hypothetical protein